MISYNGHDRPRLRPGLAILPDQRDPSYIVLYDKLRISPRQQRLTVLEFDWVRLFDGARTLHDIQAEAVRQAGILMPLDAFADLARRMDEALFLDGPRFRELLEGPVREPSCIGCYEGDPEALRRQVWRLFTGPGGPGLPQETRPDGPLRAALLPHIDYGRGGTTFAWGFKEVFERTDASLFVVIGTAHYSAHRFTLTRKNFKTPLGIVPTDQLFIDRLVRHYGDGLFDDEVTHLPEHSIELEVVFLQYLYEKRRPIRIVPLLVGPFQDCVLRDTAPSAKADIACMVEALRQVEAESGEPVCYIISGDLAHIGPKFGDSQPVQDGELEHSRRQDSALIRHAEATDMTRYFQVIADEGDRRRICGLPPTFVTLAATQPSSGKLLHYDQYVHPRRFESVSFASMAFYR
jgi:AmmeMemoRadiSam system protein B